MEFIVTYGGHNYKHGFSRYLTPLTTNNPRGHEYQTIIDPGIALFILSFIFVIV
jgi:hypothetical protein